MVSPLRESERGSDEAENTIISTLLHYVWRYPRREPITLLVLIVPQSANFDKPYFG